MKKILVAYKKRSVDHMTMFDKLQLSFPVINIKY